MPKGALEITGENLEDLLAYDDLFLDYFNHFLGLPVFPQALVYNRLTGAFDEVEGLRPEVLGSLPTISPSLHYGPTDAERELMLEWAREERLPLFLRTQLFRELKMVKLLLRPLELERQSASRGSSRNIRGYSRATESYVSSLSISGDQSGNDIYDYDDIWGELNYSALYRWQRPGSRALSLPTHAFLEGQSYGLPSSIDSASTHSTRSTIKALSAITSRRFGAASTVQFADFPEKPTDSAEEEALVPALPGSAKTTDTAKQRARISNQVEYIPNDRGVGKSSKSKSSHKTTKPPASSTEEAFLRGARVLSAPVNYEQYLKMPRLAIHDFEALFGESEPELGGQSFVQFDEDGVSLEQTETDMRTMEGRLKMSVQQVKERFLGSKKGFEEFRDFLLGTNGEHLLGFWLDCENYKDTMEDFDDIDNMEIRNANFRDIQDKYKLKLTCDARQQITRAASNMGLSHTIFLRTQYDVLRRLRAYWMPRFLLHCHRTHSLETEDPDTMEPSALPVPPVQSVIDTSTFKPRRPVNAMFPCISLVHSMPVLPEEARDYAERQLRNVAFENSVTNQRRMFPRQRSTLSASSRVSTVSVRTPNKERLLLAMASDRLAGGPFQRYLAKLEEPGLLSSLLFWEDVTEYGATEDHSSDRLLRLQHAWNIFNKYLSSDSPHRIDLPTKERERLQRHLEKAREMLEASIFDRAKTEAVDKLEKAWIRYLKEDLKTFLDCRVKPGGESPPSTADAIEVTVTEYDLVIKRPRPWVRRLVPLRVPGSSSSERARRLNRALGDADMDADARAARRAEILAKRKEMERERRKAIRAAQARTKAAKMKKTSGGTAQDALDEELPTGEDGENAGERVDRIPTFVDLTANKQIMSMFRKFVSEAENKEVHALIYLYSDIETYFGEKGKNAKKEATAAQIYKTYLDPQGKKHTPLPDKLAARAAQDKDRPKSALMKEIQKAVLPRVEEVFKEFITKQAEEFNMDPRDLITMSQSELAMRMGNDSGMLSGWNKRKSRGKDASSDQLAPLDASTPQPVTPSNLGSRGVSRASGPQARKLKKKTTGRAQATREDKNEFLSALGASASGQPTMAMLYFYKYLLKHGEEDGMPQIDKDLFFYIEVQKFKDGSHAFSDDEMLKRKVQSIVDCFLESVYTPSLQIDIPADQHSKTLKAAQRYLAGKEVVASLFDEAQFHVFKELLYYWAGYKRATATPEEINKRPITKYDKMLRKRMENIVNYVIPSSDFLLPAIPEGAIPSFTISLSEGAKFKVFTPCPTPSNMSELEESFTMTPLPDSRDTRRESKASMADNAMKKSRRGSRGASNVVQAKV